MVNNTKKKAVSFRVSAKTQKRVDEYVGDADMSESDVYRELVQKGLEYDDLKDRFLRVEERLEKLEQRMEEQREALEEERNKSLLDRIL